jgi:hypothetical protein
MWNKIVRWFKTNLFSINRKKELLFREEDPFLIL